MPWQSRWNEKSDGEGKKKWRKGIDGKEILVAVAEFEIQWELPGDFSGGAMVFSPTRYFQTPLI
jgi:hypothetical protein